MEENKSLSIKGKIEKYLMPLGMIGVVFYMVILYWGIYCGQNITL